MARASAAAALGVVLAAAFAGVGLGPGPAGVRAARAAGIAPVYLLTPSVGVGVTDNASLAQVGPKQRDEFFVFSAAATMQLEGRTSSHNLAGMLAFTQYLEGHGADTLTSLLGWTSTLKLTPVLDLSLRASGAISRTSAVDVTDLTLMMPQGTVPGSTLVFTATATQSLLYQPNPRRAYSELLSVARVRYLDAPTALPDTTLVSGTFKGLWSLARDAVFLEARVADNISGFDENAPVGAFARGHSFIGQVLAGWQRDYTPEWSSTVAGGPSITFKLAGPAVIAPVGSASLSYKRRPWFATATIAQTAAANIYLGEATINDQATVRVALPLDKAERLFVTGYAGYLYARAADTDLKLRHLFDQISGGAAINVRPLRLPMAASLQYTFLDQRGGIAGAASDTHLTRHVLLLTVSGVLAWGPGTPPLFSGAP